MSACSQLLQQHSERLQPVNAMLTLLRAPQCLQRLRHPSLRLLRCVVARVALRRSQLQHARLLSSRAIQPGD